MIKDYNIKTIGGRLLFLIEKMRSEGVFTKENKMDIGSFARSINVNESQFSRVTRNILGITLSQVMEITSIYGVRAGWLIEGEEPMFQKKSDATQAPDHNLLTVVETEIKAMQLSLNKLSTAASTIAHSLPKQIAPVQDLELGKNIDKKRRQAENVPKDSALKKDKRGIS